MSMNVSEFVWQRLSEWGLNLVYGYPGDGVGGLDVALEKAKDRVEYVQLRHEEMAAFMASAHAANVPPITLKDAAHFMSMLGSEPELGSVLKNTAKEVISTVLPGKR